MKTFVGFLNGKNLSFPVKYSLLAIIVPIFFFLSFMYYELGGGKKLLTSKYEYKNRLEKPYKGDALESTSDDILMSRHGRSY